jgi:hypothetical protein
MTSTGDSRPGQPALPTAPAEPLILTLNAGGPSLGSHRVIDFAATAVAADGREPFVWNASADRVRRRGDDPVHALISLLPTESRVTRTTERRYGVRVLAGAEDFHVFLEESTSRLEVTVSAVSPELARSIGSEILDRIAVPPTSANRVSFRVWHRGQGAQWTTKSVHVPAWESVEQNYAPSSRGEIDRLMRLQARDEDNAAGRLIVWHGAPGTGKTTAIRALADAWSSWCAPELLMDPEIAFEDPSYLSEIIAHSDQAYEQDNGAPRWRLLIAEDADRYVRADAQSRDNAGLDRLLNVADGILGQGTRLLILLTTNSELETLHPALVRPGRCLAVTDFHRFTVAEANDWLAGAPATPVGGETLAELYALRGDLERVGTLPDRPSGHHGHYL